MWELDRGYLGDGNQSPRAGRNIGLGKTDPLPDQGYRRDGKVEKKQPWRSQKKNASRWGCQVGKGAT